ncbi:MAG: hypothetical protein QOI89_2723 [Solirubrobacteraceae bacterium]|jgi:hypothetical protein|nr:hypothetical protein [Solirubrobacteraceae bacterium]
MYVVGLSTGEWIGIGVGGLGVLVSAVGLGIAIVQLKRIRKTATAVQEAVDQQKQELTGALLLTRGGELERIEADLRAASSSQEPIGRHLATQAVLAWRRTGSDLQAVFKGRSDAPADLVTAMSESLAIIDVALSDLADPAITVHDACASLLSKVSAACALAREAGGAMILTEQP